MYIYIYVLYIDWDKQAARSLKACSTMDGSIMDAGKASETNWTKQEITASSITPQSGPTINDDWILFIRDSPVNCIYNNSINNNQWIINTVCPGLSFIFPLHQVQKRYDSKTSQYFNHMNIKTMKKQPHFIFLWVRHESKPHPPARGRHIVPPQRVLITSLNINVTVQRKYWLSFKRSASCWSWNDPRVPKTHFSVGTKEDLHSVASAQIHLQTEGWQTGS